MRKVLVIAWNSLIRISRDRRSLILLMLMPLILVAILGSSLKGMMGDSRINLFRVLIVNADLPASPPLPPAAAAALPQVPTYHFGKVLAEDVLASEEVRKVISLTRLDDLNAAKAEVTAGKAVAAVYVAPTFSADVLAGRPAKVQVFTDPGQPTQANIVMQVVQSFTDAVSFGALAGRHLPPDRGHEIPGGTGTLAALDQNALPRVKEVASGARDVSAMQYYAAAMAVMFMVMTAFTRARDILQEQQQGTLARMLVSPTSGGTIIAGQILGSMAVLLAQFLVMMLGTRLVFGIYWGPWLPVLLLGFAFALAATGIGTAAAGLLRDPKAADASVGVVGNIFAALSGGMFPLYIFPAGLRTVARFIPNYWGLQGFLDQMAGVGLQSLWLPVTVLSLMGVASGALGAWRLAAKEV